MSQLKTINPNYPMVNLEFPEVIFRDATEQEKKAIHQAQEQLRKQLFYLNASANLNTMLDYLDKYPNTTFIISAEEEYNDEGYETRVRARYNCTDINEERAIENTEDNYYLAEKMSIEVIQFASKQGEVVIDKSTIDQVATILLGRELAAKWKLGKIGSEKKFLEETIATPQSQEASMVKI